ncbi:MAG TPA: bifunctional glutathionylspermidine amidase/synthase [Pseudomonadales bacterium]|nr:bifunctional glutathionylspermidine amidase/synthase [Pseudomonadales bacterium]
MHSGIPEPASARFGTVLGLAPGDVPVYSCDYESARDDELPNRHAYRSYVDGIFMGYKWQCVELARRWMYLNRGYIFDDVAMAYDIFDLRSVRVIGEARRLPLQAFRNGAPCPPEPGSLLIWDEGGHFERTGHVAVVTEVHADRICIVEQNNEDSVWLPELGCSRVLRAHRGEGGAYWIESIAGEAELIGWMTQTDDDTWAEPTERLEPNLFELVSRRVADDPRTHRAWLNEANPDEAAYVAANGQRLSSRDADRLRYLVMSESAVEKLEYASNELHAMFMHATDYVLQDDALLAKFNLPPAIWPRIHQSWDNRRNEMITGRFDFSMSARGLKVYEYNCDSASCHMETGRVQGRWAEHMDCDDGEDAGATLFDDLVAAWKERPIDGIVHVMLDEELEENYHALYMTGAMQRAGLRCKVLRGVEGLAWTMDGEIVDPDGDRIRWVWKTWAWETALDQIREECEDDAERLATYDAGAPRTDAPRLVDVLLRPGVMVFEPLWTLIPSNKAILPILWQLFPNHPFLLESAFEITDALRERGYVSKPIAGRCGHNITMTGRNDERVAETGGRFERQDMVHQELFPLPVIDGDHVQVCTFTVSGAWSASCLRIDASPVIKSESDLIALRVVEDDELRAGA